MIYKWRNAWALNATPDPQIVGERLQWLRDNRQRTGLGGVLTPASIVLDARPLTSPLHAIFEWDNCIAADQYRLSQARKIMHCLVVIQEVPDNRQGDKDGNADEDKKITREREVRAFIHIENPKKDKHTAGNVGNDVRNPGYYSIDQILDDAVLRKRVVAQALRELRRWQEKYRLYQELVELQEMIERNVRKIIDSFGINLGKEEGDEGEGDEGEGEEGEKGEKGGGEDNGGDKGGNGNEGGKGKRLVIVS